MKDDDELEEQIWPEREYFFYVKSLRTSGSKSTWVQSFTGKGKDGETALSTANKRVQSQKIDGVPIKSSDYIIRTMTLL